MSCFRSFTQVIGAALSAVAVAGFLAAGTSAYGRPIDQDRDQDKQDACSVRTLFGDYGAQIVGTRLDTKEVIRGLLLMHFDGNGNVTTKNYVVLNGTPQAPDWLAGGGTYIVDQDCTGTTQLVVPPIPLHFVIANNGREIHHVVDGGAITVVAYRVR